MPAIVTIGGIAVERRGSALTWTAGLSIDADGAPDAYHQVSSLGRDRLANAGEPGNWYGLVVVKNRPVVQGPGDPAPGFYVSPTALADRSKAITDPRRYVDSSAVPYLAIPPELLKLDVHLGDVALVAWGDRESPAIVADVGPRRRLGEGSIALAQALGIPSSPRTGGASRGVRVTLWPRSYATPRWPRPLDSIAAQVQALRREAA